MNNPKFKVGDTAYWLEQSYDSPTLWGFREVKIQKVFPFNGVDTWGEREYEIDVECPNYAWLEVEERFLYETKELVIAEIVKQLNLK